MASPAAEPASNARRAPDAVTAENDATAVAMVPIADAGAMVRTMSARQAHSRRGAPPPGATPGVSSDQVNALAATAPAESPESGGHLLLVGLALMIGIALRRWGTDSR